MGILEPDEQPVCDAFMDDDMRILWRTMTPPPGGYRLYGGTALALYLEHRMSVDFDFVTSARRVDRAALAALPWLAGAEAIGRGVVAEFLWPGPARRIRVTFIASSTLVPPPLEPPRHAPNDVPVAAPLDLVRAKLEAICNRGSANDFADMAAACRRWPALADSAFDAVPNRDRYELDVALGNPPADEEQGIPAADMAAIRQHAAHRISKDSPSGGTPQP